MFGETIEFKMRTFRFTSGGTQSSDPQQQTIECDLHLEPSATIVQEQAADCTCYTQEQCQGKVKRLKNLRIERFIGTNSLLRVIFHIIF